MISRIAKATVFLILKRGSQANEMKYTAYTNISPTPTLILVFNAVIRPAAFSP